MFDNNLRYAREELEMTQSELGYIFGVSDSAVDHGKLLTIQYLYLN